MRAVKHFRLEGDGKKYLLALLPIDFGKLVTSSAMDPAVATEGFFLLVIDDDAYVEADPYGWGSKDKDLGYAHFYLRENASKLRGGTVLKVEAMRAAVSEVMDRLTKLPTDELLSMPEPAPEAEEAA